ncbi:MAG: cyanophycinase [Chitinophagaceae bacterium]|nr:cyanophycinase [Chitinophagaceae bacterium]
MYRSLLLFKLYLVAIALNAQNPMNRLRPASLGITGDTADIKTATSPGLLLAGGGGDVDEAMRWLLQRSGGGDVVIIRASGGTGYNKYLYELEKVNSVESLLINSRELANNDTVVQIVRNAEALFIAGGDQWNYVQYWKGTQLNEAIQYLIMKKKVPIGGTSAGLAILGQYCFDAKNGSITSDTALRNPMHPKMSISQGFIKHPLMKGWITDSHYAQRNRQGRHMVMLAKISSKNRRPNGLGIDEKTAVALDDKGTLLVFGENEAWFLKAGKKTPQTLNEQDALTWQWKGRAVKVIRVKGSQPGTPAGNLLNGGIYGGQTEYWEVVNGTLLVHPYLPE